MKLVLVYGFMILLAFSEWWLFVSTSKNPRLRALISRYYTLALSWRTKIPWPYTILKHNSKWNRNSYKRRAEKRDFSIRRFFALAISPLSRMNYVAAYWAWIGFTAILYSASILLLIRESHGNALILALTAVACPAFHSLILAGQTTVIALFIFVLVYLAMTRQLYSITGALIVLLASPPPDLSCWVSSSAFGYLSDGPAIIT